MLQSLFSWAVVPLLGAATLFQWSVLLGPPPAMRLLGLAPDVASWLGLAGFDTAALWLLFLAYGCSVLLVHFEAWAHCARRQREQHARLAQQQAGGEGQLSRASSFDGIEGPAPLLGGCVLPPVDSGVQGEAHELPEAGHTALQVSPSTVLPGPQLWQPLTLEAQPQWRWQDWLRYLVYRWARLRACHSVRSPSAASHAHLPDASFTAGHAPH